MTVFDNMRSKSIDEFTEWLDKYGQFDNSPWMKWFNEKYCSNCEPIMCHCEGSEAEFPCGWCELNDNKCKFFPDMDHSPDNRDIIKMWLESESDTK
jgi:hypothetical protein